MHVHFVGLCVFVTENNKYTYIFLGFIHVHFVGLCAFVTENNKYTYIFLGFVLSLQRKVNTRTFCWALSFC